MQLTPLELLWQTRLGTSVQGNVDFLRQRFGAEADLSVVIAADVRIFKDLRGSFPSGVANPLIDMTSEDLSRQAAAIYAANGVDVLGTADLARVGRVDGLASGERIYAMRFVGDHGFMVTFRQACLAAHATCDAMRMPCAC